MSAIEDIPTMSAEDYVVEVFKRTSWLDDAGRWERGDALVRLVREKQGPEARSHERAASSINDGTRRIIEQCAERLHREHDIKEELETVTLARYRSVALAWPEEDRFKEASYYAHQEIAAKKWDGKRAAYMRKLVERSSDDRVTQNDVRVWRQHKEKKPSVPWDAKMEKRIKSLCLTSDMRPGGPLERVFLAKLLREVAQEVEALDDR